MHNKSKDDHYELIYKNKLLTIKEVPFYPGNLSVIFYTQDDKVIQPFLFYIINHLKKIVSFEEIYLLVSKCANKADVCLWPWTQDLVNRFKQPSRYDYPCKTRSFTKRLQEIFRGSFKDNNCEKFVDTTQSNGFETPFENILPPIESTYYFFSNKRKKTNEEIWNDIMEIFSLYCDIKGKKRKKNRNLSIVK
ncbi:hypothetical protein [Rickettsiella grylli]|uniref:Uncharacterized protein n=1 Tax=Rickettsiella grylli TaxID=59196 RepID=A8PPA6_9COXI|nr:hypothetical protein [Rickettsiella grylli]EDP46425.1 hypothetical protein RICGR_1248 [Rickettsiella grylli]